MDNNISVILFLTLILCSPLQYVLHEHAIKKQELRKKGIRKSRQIKKNKLQIFYLNDQKKELIIMKKITIPAIIKKASKNMHWQFCER